MSPAAVITPDGRAPTSATQDTFSINVDDGHGGVTPVSVTATISPHNTAPTVSYSKVKLLVTATYTVTYDDADGDAATYTITTAPTRGTLISTGLGIFAYASTSLGAPDSFTITVSDGHGGTVTTPSSTGRRASRLPSSGP